MELNEIAIIWRVVIQNFMSQPTWDHFRSFLGVLQNGSLSGAARALSLTQPTVARHIAQLEDALGGASLFTRSPVGLTPTAAGLRLRPHAEAMAAAAAAMQRTAQGDATTTTGVVRITASEVVGAEVLPPILRDLQSNHPGLIIELVLSNATSDLLAREADIAVRMMRPQQKALVARRVGAVPLGLFGHQSYLERCGTPHSLNDLASHALIGVDRDSATLQLIEAAGLRLPHNSVTLRADNQLAQIAALRAGCGIGLCQTALARQSPELVQILIDATMPALDMWVTMHEDLTSDRRMRVTFDHLYAALVAYLQHP